MKADFEKGTKVCGKCKRELPISEFVKDKGKSDGLYNVCKECSKEYRRTEKAKQAQKKINDKRLNTFGRVGCKRGQNSMLKRDYELTEEQLKRRNRQRNAHRCKIKRRTP